MATPRADGSDQSVRAIGRYQFVSEIAPGAFGALWKARIASGPEQGRIVSIRRVPRTSAPDKQAVERLTNAGFAAMEVRHPKIGAVLDVVVGDSEIAFVSEYIEGALLAALLRPPSGKRPNVSPDVALRIIIDVLEAVAGVHAQWRDLFPSTESDDDRALAAAAHGGLVPDSVLLATFGEAMLLDGGLAGIAMTMPPILDHADVIAYRAPEQLDGSGRADERSDVFTVGIFGWELLAARPLFAPAIAPHPSAAAPAVKTKAFSDAMQVSTVKRKVLTAAIQRLDSLPLLKGRVSKAFADIIARCLERDPANRYQSVRELIQALTELGPRAVAGHDAVSRLLTSVGAGAPSEDALDPSSGRSTSNRPTAPPEKRGVKDSAPPDTRRAPSGAKAVPAPLDATPRRTSVETMNEGDRLTAPGEEVEEEPLSTDDLESIPPTADVESLPPSTDVQSSLPSTDSRSTSPNATASDVIGSDVGSLLLSPPETAPSEETTSAPVVRPVDDSGDLASTVPSTSSGRAANKKIVIGVAAAAGVLALVGLIRVATSNGEKDTAPLGASAAPSSAPPSPSAVEAPPPAETVEPPASADAPVPAGPAAARVPASPTSAPAPSPAGAPQQVPVKRLPPPPLQPQPQPVKKKVYRPSGI